MSSQIIYTMQTDARRMESTIANLQNKVQGLHAAMRKMSSESRSQEKAAVSAFSRMANSVKNFVGMYLGAAGVHAVISKTIELLREQERIGFRSLDEASRRSIGQNEINKRLADATPDQKRQLIDRITSVAAREGADVGETLMQAAQIVSSTEGRPADRIKTTIDLVESNIAEFAGALDGLGAFAGSINDIKKLVGGRVSDEGIKGLVGLLSSQGRVTTDEGLQNAMRSIPTAPVLFGGDVVENVQTAAASVGAFTSALVDTTGALSATANTNFMATLSRNKQLRDMAGGPDSSYLDTLKALYGAPERFQQEVLEPVARELLEAELRGDIKGKALTRAIQESGLSAEGFLSKKIMEFVELVRFDEKIGKGVSGFARDGTKEIRARRGVGQGEQGNKQVENALLTRSRIRGELLGKDGSGGVLNQSVGFGQSAENAMDKWLLMWRNMTNDDPAQMSENAKSLIISRRAMNRFAMRNLNRDGIQSDEFEEFNARQERDRALTASLDRLTGIMQEYMESQQENARKNTTAAMNSGMAVGAQAGKGLEE